MFPDVSDFFMACIHVSGSREGEGSGDSSSS